MKKPDKSDGTESSAKMQTLKQLMSGMIAETFNPVPCPVTLRRIFDQHHVRRFKNTPDAKRGGGTVFYNVEDIQKVIANMTLPGRLPRQ